MKKLKVEFNSFEHRELNPTKAFTDELSRQITPKILDTILEKKFINDIFKMIVISIDSRSYGTLRFFDGVNRMKISISAYSTSFILCSFYVYWITDNQEQVNPWNDILDKSLTFDVSISSSELKGFNRVLPELYHPIVKAEESGLPFDYQIYYGGETLKLYFKEPITDRDISNIKCVIDSFISSWNVSHNSQICIIDLIAQKTQIKIVIDLRSCNEELVEHLIHSFYNQKNIRKIVLQ